MPDWWKIFNDRERMASIRKAVERGDIVKVQSLILDGLERHRRLPTAERIWLFFLWIDDHLLRHRWKWYCDTLFKLEPMRTGDA